MRTPTLLCSLLLALAGATVGCASTSDRPGSTWDERNERIDQQHEDRSREVAPVETEGEADAEPREASSTRAVTERRTPASAWNKDKDKHQDKSSDLAPVSDAPADHPEPVERRTEGRADADRRAGAAPADLTPIDQGNNKRDLEITQAIRQAVIDDPSLSFTAKNAKIITKNGVVTLAGEVKNATERTNIEKAARGVAGAANVNNQLVVNP